MENYQKLPGKIMMISTDLSPKVIINNHFKCWWTKLFLNEQNVAYCGWWGGGGEQNKTHLYAAYRDVRAKDTD